MTHMCGDDNHPEPNTENDLVRPRSPDENPRCHTVRLVSPGDRRKARPASGRSRTHEPFDRSEPVAGRFRSQSPVLTSCESPICIPTHVPTGFTVTSWSLPLSGDDSRTNRPQLRGNVCVLYPEFAFAGATTRALLRDTQLLQFSAASESAPSLPKRWMVRSFPGIHRL